MAKRAASAMANPGLVIDDRTVRVKVSPKMLYDIDSITKVLRNTLGKLGCEACCSGHDIRFEIERSFVADAKLNVRPG